MKNYIKSLGANWPVIIFTLLVLVFFYPFIAFGKIPIPADTIVGMYHPWRDVVWDGLSSGVPFKNFLITDPVRQQYLWRKEALDQIKEGQLPLWNPYSFSGMPLMANFQTGILYPLNLIFFLLPFNHVWGLLVVLEPLLAGLFLFLYLRNLKVTKIGSLFGSLVFSFSGFSIVWMEWNTIGHVIAWLPLTLLAIDTIIQKQVRPLSLWPLIFVISLIFSFFAGHLQIFFYCSSVILLYLGFKIYLLKQNRFKTFLLFVYCYLLFIFITSIQWWPTLQLILKSARDIDQGSWTKEGWFIPWQNLIQFVAPDFFGNPATNNYWGIWNYAEFIGYIGMLPLIFALYSIFYVRNKTVIFYGLLSIGSLIFALPTVLSALPYKLNIPLISTSQPTRLIFIVSFSLSVLSSIGFDYWVNDKNKRKIYYIIVITALFLLWGWLSVSFPSLLLSSVKPEFLSVSRRNLIMPTVLIVTSVIILSVAVVLKRKSANYISTMIILLVVFDLYRFGWKFTPFSAESWIFPSTKIMLELKSRQGEYRIMALDRRILPPNFSVAYKLNDVSGYDPLYIKQYSQLVSSWEKNAPDLSSASFNRIITPQNYDSFITDLLGVKYLLSLQPLNSPKLQLVDLQGETYLYENRRAFPRAFFVEKVVKADEDYDLLAKMFSLGDKLMTTAVLTDDLSLEPEPLKENETVKIVNYSPNQVDILVDTEFKRLMVLTDIYYPAWKVYLDGVEVKLYKVNFIFRGVLVPVGSHRIEFKSGII